MDEIDGEIDVEILRCSITTARENHSEIDLLKRLRNTLRSAVHKLVTNIFVPMLPNPINIVCDHS